MFDKQPFHQPSTSTTPNRVALTLLTAASFTLAVAGCTNRVATGGSTATAAPGSAAPARAVDVALTEWAVTPSTSTAAPGTLTFTATNVGREVHELVLFRTDLRIDRLPLDAEGAVDERGTGIDLVDEVEDVKPGASKSFTATLEPGQYALVCNVVDKDTKHYHNNMYATFTVW